MVLDSKFHPLNVGFHQSDKEGIYSFHQLLNGYEYCIYVSTYIYQDKPGLEHTITVKHHAEVAVFSMSFDLLKTNREFYEVVSAWEDISPRFVPLRDYVRSEYRKAMIDEVLNDLV